MFRLGPSRKQAIQQIQFQRMMGPAQQAGEMFGGPAFWGAALTGAIGNRFGKNANTLPPEMEARVTAQENAERRVQEENEFFETLDAGQKSRYYRRILAEEAMRAGLPEIGMPLFKQVSEEHEASEKQRLELEKLEIGIDTEKLNQEKKILDIEKEKLGRGKNKFTTIYPVGSSNPNSGRLAWIREDGSAEVEPGQYISLGKYTTTRPQRPPKADGGKETSVKDMYTPSELAKLRTQMRDVMSQMRASLRIVDVMKESMSSTGSIDILGAAGSTSSFVTKVVDEVSAMARVINKAAGRPNPSGLTIEGSGSLPFVDDDVTLDGTLESAAEYAAGWTDGDQWVPAAIRKDETQARRYKATLVNLAYAVARSEEPGNPRLSDDDFKRNLEQIASSTTNPETLRRVLLDRINASAEDFNVFMKQITPEVRRKSLAPAALEEYEALTAEFEDVFSRPFGTAAHPGPGLTGKPDQNSSKDLGDGFSVVIH